MTATVATVSAAFAASKPWVSAAASLSCALACASDNTGSTVGFKGLRERGIERAAVDHRVLSGGCGNRTRKLQPVFELAAGKAAGLRQPVAHHGNGRHAEVKLLDRDLVGRINRRRHRVAQRLEDGLKLEIKIRDHQITSSRVARSCSKILWLIMASQDTTIS